ncbi:HRDC domain-containing protein, partial [Synechococcus sp. Lug-A]|uniref:HRDC domain-containing protein n=1 Tax=Synechococcus sp. Lug-A TaxID=2823740 RepID=UPI0020CD2FE4
RHERRSRARSGALSGAAGAAGAGADGQGADLELLQRLQDWRREQAREQAVPPYVVFHDRTLVELAARRPLQIAELAAISGIGAAKLERYGSALLSLLKSDS